MKQFFLAALLLAGLVLPAGAEPPQPKMQRIAVVDLDKVFREYYKSRIAEEAIRQQGEVYRSYLLKLNEQHQKLQEEASRLLMNAQNIALSDEERRRSVRSAEEKRREVEEKKSEIELYASERSKDLRRVEEDKRQEIMRDILLELKRRSTAEGYDFVFDSSGKTLNQQPGVLLFPASVDLTAQLIAELNRRATIPAKPSAPPVPTSVKIQPSKEDAKQ